MTKKKRLVWHNEQHRLGDLAEWPKNPRQLDDHDAEHIERSIVKFGLADPLIVNADGQIIGGHQRKRIMLALEAYGPDAVIDVRVPSRKLTKREAEELAIRLNRNSGAWDWEGLKGFELDDLRDWGFTDLELSINHPDAIEFPEYDESIADEVEYLECPECGHKWPK